MSLRHNVIIANGERIFEISPVFFEIIRILQKHKYFLFMTVDDIAKVKLPEWVGG